MRRAAILLLLTGCAGGAPERRPARPSVLLILSDDQRPDTIGALGCAQARTPALDALVREGTSFTRAVSPNPVCVPSRAEILTGASGFRNGILPGYADRLDRSLPTWPAAMAAAGYRTAYVGKWHTQGTPSEHGYREAPGLFVGGLRETAPRSDLRGRPITGYRGWHFRTEAGRPFPEKGVGLTEETDVHIADAAIGFLRSVDERPFFLHVNFVLPHDPLMPPSRHRDRFDAASMPLPADFLPEHPFDHGNLAGRDEQLWPSPRSPEEVRTELALYHASVAHVDEQVGRILEALRAAGRADDTIVVFSSDHGLAVGSHGLRGKQNMYEHTVGVPLVFRGPGIPRGAVRRAQVYLRELFPTLCDLAGVPAPPTPDARSFAGVVRGAADVHREEIFGYWEDAQRMVRTDEWKLIHYPRIGRVQLFRLPDERVDLSDDPSHAATRAALHSRLAAWQESVGDPLLRR